MPIKYNISRNKNLLGREMEQLVTFLGGIAKKDTSCSSRLEFSSVTFGNDVITKTAKYSDLSVGRRISIEQFKGGFVL